MRTISVAVSEDDYEALRRWAKTQGRPIAMLIREAMAHYRTEVLERPSRLTDLPVLAGHRALGPLPERSEIYDEIFDRGGR